MCVLARVCVYVFVFVRIASIPYSFFNIPTIVFARYRPDACTGIPAGLFTTSVSFEQAEEEEEDAPPLSTAAVVSGTIVSGEVEG